MYHQVFCGLCKGSFLHEAPDAIDEGLMEGLGHITRLFSRHATCPWSMTPINTPICLLPKVLQAAITKQGNAAGNLLTQELCRLRASCVHSAKDELWGTKQRMQGLPRWGGCKQKRSSPKSFPIAARAALGTCLIVTIGALIISHKEGRQLPGMGRSRLVPEESAGTVDWTATPELSAGSCGITSGTRQKGHAPPCRIMWRQEVHTK